MAKKTRRNRKDSDSQIVEKVNVENGTSETLIDGADSSSQVSDSIGTSATISAPVVESPVVVEQIIESPKKLDEEMVPTFHVDPISESPGREDPLPEEAMSPFMSPSHDLKMDQSMSPQQVEELTISPMTNVKTVVTEFPSVTSSPKVNGLPEPIISGSPVVGKRLSHGVGVGTTEDSVSSDPLRDSVDMSKMVASSGVVYLDGDLVVTVQGEPVSPAQPASSFNESVNITISPKSTQGSMMAAYPVSPAVEECAPAVVKPVTPPPALTVASIVCPDLNYSPGQEFPSLSKSMENIPVKRRGSGHGFNSPPRVECSDNPVPPHAVSDLEINVATASEEPSQSCPATKSVTGSVQYPLFVSSPTPTSMAVQNQSLVSPKVVIGPITPVSVFSPMVEAAPASVEAPVAEPATTVSVQAQMTMGSIANEEPLVDETVAATKELSPIQLKNASANDSPSKTAQMFASSAALSNYAIFLSISLEDAIQFLVGHKINMKATDVSAVFAGDRPTNETKSPVMAFFANCFGGCFKASGVSINVSLADEKDTQTILANTPVNSQVDMHRRMLSTIFQFFTHHGEGDRLMVGDHWEKQIGFSSVDPTNEINNSSSKVLVLVFILYLIEYFAQDAHKLFDENCTDSEGEFRLPFGMAAIEVADTIVQTANKRKLNAVYNNHKSVMGVSGRLFVALMIQFVQEWKRSKFKSSSKLDISHAKSRIRNMINNASAKQIENIIATVPKP